MCFVNSVHTSVDLVADLLGTAIGASYVDAGPARAPLRVLDTRI